MNAPYCPRLLCVENDPLLLPRLVQRLQHPTPEESAAYCVEGFEVETAVTAAQARRLLADAGKSMRPFDIVLLDLGIPEQEGQPDPPEVGLALLDDLRARYPFSLGAVIVQTSWDTTRNFIQLLRAQVADFLPKPIDNLATFFATVVNVYRKTQEREQARWLERRRLDAERWLLAQTSFLTVDRMARETMTALSSLRGRLCETQSKVAPSGAGRDAWQQALDDGLEEVALAVARSRLMPGGTEAQVEEVELNQICDRAVVELREDVFLRRAAIDRKPGPGSEIRTFAPDLALLVRERLLAVLETANPGQTVTLQVDAGPRLVVGDVSPLAPQDALRLAGGDAIWPRDGRVWRLAFIRQLARSLGGEFSLGVGPSLSRLEIALPESING